MIITLQKVSAIPATVVRHLVKAGNIIRWPISDNTIATSTASDATAMALYAKLYSVYKSGSDPVLGVDCLGIAMYSLCAYSYPTCTPNDQYGVPSTDTSDKPYIVADVEWFVSGFATFGKCVAQACSNSTKQSVQIKLRIHVHMLFAWQKLF